MARNSAPALVRVTLLREVWCTVIASQGRRQENTTAWEYLLGRGCCSAGCGCVRRFIFSWASFFIWIFSLRYLLGFVIFFLIPLPFYSFYYFAYFFFLFFWRDFPCFVLFLLFSRLLSSFDFCFVLFSFCFILFCFLHIFPFLPFILFIILFFPVPSLFPIFYLTLHFLSLFLFFSFSLPPSFILSFAFPFTN